MYTCEEMNASTHTNMHIIAVERVMTAALHVNSEEKERKKERKMERKTDRQTEM
jgi:hypothetical protein